MVTRTALAAIAVGALTLPVGLVAPATASHGGNDVRTSGSCSGTAHWKLKHNGSTSARGTKRTTGPSGSFQVQRRMANLAGKDHFTLRATHGAQVCRGTISY